MLFLDLQLLHIYFCYILMQIDVAAIFDQKIFQLNQVLYLL